MGTVVHVGGPLVSALVFAAILESATPIKPFTMVVGAIIQIVYAATPVMAVGGILGLVYFVAKLKG